MPRAFNSLMQAQLISNIYVGSKTYSTKSLTKDRFEYLPNWFFPTKRQKCNSEQSKDFKNCKRR